MCWHASRPSRASSAATGSGRSPSAQALSATARSGGPCAASTRATKLGWTCPSLSDITSQLQGFWRRVNTAMKLGQRCLSLNWVPGPVICPCHHARSGALGTAPLPLPGRLECTSFCLQCSGCILTRPCWVWPEPSLPHLSLPSCFCVQSVALSAHAREGSQFQQHGRESASERVS